MQPSCCSVLGFADTLIVSIVSTGSKKKPIVFGSVGSYGALQHDGSEYTGSFIDRVSPELLTEWHRPRVQGLIDAGVDFLAFETLPSAVEAFALLRLLREFPNQKAWISFTCKVLISFPPI